MGVSIVRRILYFLLCIGVAVPAFGSKAAFELVTDDGVPAAPWDAEPYDAFWESRILGGSYDDITVVTGAEAGSVELNVAELLQQRIAEAANMKVKVAREGEAIGENSLQILLGIPAHHRALQAWFEETRTPALTGQNPGPEGFLVQLPKDFLIIAAGVDDRGVLYAAGELLRRMNFHNGSIQIASLGVRTAPAFEVRGTQYGQSHIAKSLGKVRPWTDAERQRVVLDYALAGANAFDVDEKDIAFFDAYGLMTQTNYGPNVGTGPPEWMGMESIGRGGYLCPSVPEARQHLLEKCEAYFSTSPKYDFVKLVGGDGGGCECDRCDPYGLTFIKLCEDMAKIIHKYSPESRVWFTNQKFDDADDQAIFKYLQEQPREWLWAWGYGPGSDGMSWQPGHRQTHRMDLFRYPGFGPFDRYNQEIVHQLPPQQTLMHYNELTHWRYSQHGYVQMYPRPDKNGDLPPWQNHFIYERRPDQALTMVYDRLTFFAWPRYLHWLFGEVNRYGAGDITHSSGHHDQFNQWMWQRLLWAPQMRVEDVVNEYCDAWFGPEAAPLMAKALYQLEKNLEEERPILLNEKPGIEAYYALVKEAGTKIPRHQQKTHRLWREYMQKGALDLYTKHSVQQQVDLQARVESRTQRALARGNLDKTIDRMLPWFEQLDATPRMVQLRTEAEQLGEESNALFGVRNEGIFNLKHDFIGLGWLKRQLERARAAQTDAEKRGLLHMVVAYEDPGPGGFYDNLGTFNRAPNVVSGSPYDHGQPFVKGMLDEGNRASQKSMHSTQEQAQGVTLHYRGLDPGAQYHVRFTFVRPWFQERYAQRMNQKSQTIYADDQVVAKDVELPLQMSDFFTYDLPAEATKDGEVVIRLEKQTDVATGDRVTVEQWRNSGGWGTLVSEAWLMKK